MLCEAAASLMKKERRSAFIIRRDSVAAVQSFVANGRCSCHQRIG